MEIQGYFTAKGLALSAKLLSGAKLKVTSVAAGSGSTANPATTTALPKIKQTLAVNTPTHRGNTAVIPATLVAAQAAADYTLTELGVYANDPDAGEILYKVYKLSEPVDIASGSSMVLRFYLEETVAQDLNVDVVCSPAGLITEEVFAPVRNKANGLRESNATYQVDAAELQETINSLPRCLTQDVTLIVSGTVTENISVNDFYGNGKLYIRGSAKADFSVLAQVCFANCRCKVSFGIAAMQPDSTGTSASMLVFQNCSDAEAIDLAISGASRGVVASRSNVLMNSVSITGCDTALLVSYDSCVTVRKWENADAPTYSGNDVGVYTWNGGTVFLCGSIPNTLGGAANSNQGGLIVSNNGALL